MNLGKQPGSCHYPKAGTAFCGISVLSQDLVTLNYSTLLDYPLRLYLGSLCRCDTFDLALVCMCPSSFALQLFCFITWYLKSDPLPLHAHCSCTYPLPCLTQLSLMILNLHFLLLETRPRLMLPCYSLTFQKIKWVGTEH